MPQTTRANKIPGLGLNQHAKVVADHRRKAEDIFGAEIKGSVESALGSARNEKLRNISQTAWNKIRQVEMKKQDRLNFNL